MARSVGLGLGLLLAAGLLILTPGRTAADDIQTRQQELQQLNAQQQQGEQELAASRQRREALNARLLEIEKSVYSTLERQHDAELQLAQTVVETDDLAHQVKMAEDALSRHQADLDRRLVAIYKTGPVSTLELLAESEGFSDMLSKADGLEALAGRDQELVSRVQVDRQALTAQREQLLERQNRAVDLKAQVEREKAAVEAQLAAQAALLQDATIDERQLASALTDMDEKAQELTDSIRRLQTAKARITANTTPAVAPGKPMQASSSGFSWPLSGTITTRFGGSTPYQSFHTGMDIAPGAMYVPIMAAADGVVIKSGYYTPGNRSIAYGMMVLIDHGDGITTLYGHMDDRAHPPPVSEGEEVHRGQVVGYVGMTGYTTGPHLHFEVRIDGGPVDPMRYLP